MYAHKLLKPQSNFVKYRGNTGQIDVRDSVISILSRNPGLRGVDVAKLIYDKNHMPLSFGYVYKVLRQLASEQVITRSSDNFYYLTSDAISHDMSVTMQTAEKLDNIGIDLKQARFLSSGIIMAAEQHIAEANDCNFNIDETVATGVASAPDPMEMSQDEIDEQIDEVTQEVEFPANFNPEKGIELTDIERAKLRAETTKQIREEREAEEAEKARAERQQKLDKFKTAQSLLGQEVRIDPAKYSGEVVGTILELRPTGVTFLITFSSDDNVEEGTVLPIEYSQGVSYKLIID